MTNHEKMVNLIINAKRADPETGSFTDFLADFLLGYGVKLPEDNETAIRSAPAGDPLTLEQLREMDGQPVFLPETNCWALVTKDVFVMLFTFPDGEKCSANDWYKQVGPVYTSPPHHIDREAWVSVEDRLPKMREDVLVCAYWHEKWGVYKGWYAGHCWYVSCGIGDRNDVQVSHWRPMPKPPEEGRP